MKKLKNIAYLIGAILLSPILGAFVGASISDFGLLFIIDFKSWVHNIPALIKSNIAYAVLAIVYGTPVVIAYGVPVFFLLKKLKFQNVWTFGLFGLLPTTIGTLVSWSQDNLCLETYCLISILKGALVGFSTACFFWFIAVYTPSRSTKQGVIATGN